MTVDKVPVETTRVEEEALDFNDRNVTSKRILSTSSSSSEGGSIEIDDIDTDSDSGGDSTQPEVDEKSNEKIEESDREAILHQLADLASSESEGKILLDLIAMRFGSGKWDTKKSEKSSKILEDEETSAKDRHELLVDDLRETLKALPDSLLHFTTGWFRPGDCERPADQIPEWFDEEKFRRGQKFTQDHRFSVLYCEFVSSLAFFSFDDGLKPLIHSGNSSTPYTAFKRYLSTVARTRHWYSHDPWVKGSAAWKDMTVVRSLHNAMRRKLKASTVSEIDKATKISNAWCPSQKILLKDFSETCKAPVVGQCPYFVGQNNPNRPRGISQTDMAATQWIFVGLLTIFPERFGVHSATDEDLEAFCHLWRCLGYQLGIEDEYNLCRGTFKEIQQRCRDLLESWIKPNLRVITPEWEHMGRCLISGMAILVPLATYETVLLYVLEIMDLQMPRFYASLSYKDWFLYHLMRSFINYGLKVPGMSSLSGRGLDLILDRAENYTPKELEAIRIKLSKYPVNN